MFYCSYQPSHQLKPLLTQNRASLFLATLLHIAKLAAPRPRASHGLDSPLCRHLRPERDLEDAAARQSAEEEGAQRRQHRAGQAGARGQG